MCRKRHGGRKTAAQISGDGTASDHRNSRISVYFSSLACGPPSFFARRKKAKTCQGASPPGPPGGLPAFFGGKPAVARLPESTIKKGCGPGVWGWLHFFGPAPTPTPGASGPPCCMDVGSRKPAKSPGVWGQSPRRLFASFLHAEKGCGRAGQTHSINYDFLCAHAAIKHRCALAPPFLATRTGEKNRQGAFPPESPGGFVDFLSMKIDYDHVA